MSLIDNIREKVEIGLFEFSKHAVDQSIIRRISVQDVREVVTNFMSRIQFAGLTSKKGDHDESIPGRKPSRALTPNNSWACKASKDNRNTCIWIFGDGVVLLNLASAHAFLSSFSAKNKLSGHRERGEWGKGFIGFVEFGLSRWPWK